MVETSQKLPLLDQLPVHHDRDHFLCRLIGELTSILQEVVGIEESSGFVSVVGQRIGEHINEEYLSALDQQTLSRQQISGVLVDLKSRIHGDFYLIEQDDEKIVLGNHTCPFGEFALGRPSLCMMTSNVFGVVTAENLGYARVEIEKAIAQGHKGCRIVIHLQPADESKTVEGREYFKSASDDGS